jgi:hypothetical protein
LLQQLRLDRLVCEVVDGSRGRKDRNVEGRTGGNHPNRRSVHCKTRSTQRAIEQGAEADSNNRIPEICRQIHGTLYGPVTDGHGFGTR